MKVFLIILLIIIGIFITFIMYSALYIQGKINQELEYKEFQSTGKNKARN